MIKLQNVRLSYPTLVKPGVAPKQDQEPPQSQTHWVEVLRAETLDGMGPWECGAFRSVRRVASDEGSTSPDQHPSPYCDPSLSEVWTALLSNGGTSDWYFGFTDVDQFRRWFSTPAQRRALADVGIILATYLVDPGDLLIGTHQIVFRKSRAVIRQNFCTTTGDQS